MTQVLAIGLTVCVPAIVTLAILYARESHKHAESRIATSEAALAVAEVGGTLRATEEQRDKWRSVAIRREGQLHDLEQYCAHTGDANAVRRRIDDLLAGLQSDEDPNGGEASPDAGNVPAGAASTEAGSGASD